MWSSLILLTASCLSLSEAALPLPDYIKPCSRNDPNLNRCATKHAVEAIPQFINGDPKYRVPPLQPLVIEHLSVSQGTSNFGLAFEARNATLGGLKNAQVKEARIDLKKQHIEYDLFFPTLDIHCRYNVSGRVLVLPITGNGDGHLVLKDVKTVIAFDYENVRKSDKEKVHLKPENSTLKLDVTDMSIHLENLFNGDKFLSNNMNNFLNENWKELLRDIGPAIEEALNQVVVTILTNIFELVPYDYAFPEKSIEHRQLSTQILASLKQVCICLDHVAT